MVERGVPELDGQLNSLVGRVSDIERRLREMTDVTAPLDTSVRGKEYATVVIAAANTRDGKSRANVVCSGSGDDLTIKNAILKYCPIEQEDGQDVVRGRVLLLEGDYHFTGYDMDFTFLACSGLEFAGLGGGTIIHVGENADGSGPAFYSGPAAFNRGITIRDLWVRAYEFSTGYTCTILGSSDQPDVAIQALVSNVTVETPSYAGIIVSGIGAMVRDCTVWGSGATDSGATTGIMMNGMYGSVQGSRVLKKETDDPASWLTAIWCQYSRNRIVGNEITAGTRGIEVNGGSVVVGNYLHEDTAQAESAQYAIQDFGSGQGGIIADNLVYGWSQGGIYIGNGCEAASVSDNHVIDGGNLTDPGTAVGTKDDGTKSKLNDNTVRGGYNYGMHINGTDAMVRDNDLRDSGTTANYQDDGVGTDELGSMF